MSTGFWNAMSEVAANSKPGILPTATPPYTFTEIIDVAWTSPVDLDYESSQTSQLWSKIIGTYVKHHGTSRVWWGQHLESKETAKLVIDWKTAEGRAAFHASHDGSSILDIWKDSPASVTTSEPEFYAFPAMQGYRQNAFQPPSSSSKESVTVFTTFHLPLDWKSDEVDQKDELKRTKKNVWDTAWSIFREAALKSEGAWIADKSLDAWSVGADWRVPDASEHMPKSVIGVFRFANAQTAEHFVDGVKNTEPSEGNGGLEKLKVLAERGMNVEAVNMQYESVLDTEL